MLLELHGESALEELESKGGNLESSSWAIEVKYLLNAFPMLRLLVIIQ